MATPHLPHILLSNPPEHSIYIAPGTGGGGIDPVIPRDRRTHGQFLQQKFDQAWQNAVDERAVTHAARNGVYLEFISDPGAALVIQSLEDMRSKQVRLLNVRQITTSLVGADGTSAESTTTYATVYVANEQKKYFANKIAEYLTQETPANNPKNQPLINSIANIRQALLVDSFWSDSISMIPQHEPEWVEVWLSSNADGAIAGFERLLTQAQVSHRNGVLRFPERSVKVIFANREQLAWLTQHCDLIAEYRRAKTTAAFFIELNNADQAHWTADVLGRLQVDVDSESVVCILDTGVNFGHPLLESLLQSHDCHSVNPAWGTHDHNSHGSYMAGIAAYGDLTAVLESNEPVRARHHLESVKLLPPPPHTTHPDLWGYVTSQAISRAEIQAPRRNRCICMAITAEDTRDRGRPTSWSAQLDQLASGSEDGTQRLIVVSAGNATSTITDAARLYPEVQLSDSIHDPAQSWNALTVGACTALGTITDPNLAHYSAVAPQHGLSPFSTTSATWEENMWPIKPELVAEGGNLAIDNEGFATECDDLSLLSTSFDPNVAHFGPFSMTSAATARVSWMAGQLQAHNSSFWPETIRGLLIHSARWPDALKTQFIDDERKSSYKHLLSICGYGVPDLDRAMYSAMNSLTLIAQQSLQPFDKQPRGKSGYRTLDMHLYELPWPTAVLQDLPYGTEIEMRVTLSYFVEPGPGEIGWQDRYRYASHGLRFDLNSPGESKQEFMARVNKAARDADEGKPGTRSPADHWLLGSQARNRGSVHSDIWKGTAQDLATSNLIAISPTIGWWRERAHLGRWDRCTRYSLIISIVTPEEAIDIYTPVTIQVGIANPVIITT